MIRTRDLYVPNVALYQAEPHPADNGSVIYSGHSIPANVIITDIPKINKSLFGAFVYIIGVVISAG